MRHTCDEARPRSYSVMSRLAGKGEGAGKGGCGRLEGKLEVKEAEKTKRRQKGI